jgi:hypothetical protein
MILTPSRKDYRFKSVGVGRVSKSGKALNLFLDKDRFYVIKMYDLIALLEGDRDFVSVAMPKFARFCKTLNE